MTHTEAEALKLALEALEAETDPNWECNSYHPKIWEAITAIKQALAAPVQEPVAWMDKYGEIYKDVTEVLSTDTPLYTTPPAAQRQWVGLTDEEVIDVIHPLVMADMPDQATDYEIARAIEAKLKEKNNG